MKNNLLNYGLLVLIACQFGCEKPDDPSTLVGYWNVDKFQKTTNEIGGSSFSYSDAGYINFEDESSGSCDYTGITPYDFTWTRTDSTITLTKIENGYVYDYSIEVETENNLELKYEYSYLGPYYEITNTYTLSISR